MNPYFLNLYKPAGPSSFDVIRKLKKFSKFKKIGHFGTLDPFAAGVLLIGVNGATKIMDFVSQYPKTYIAVGKLDQFSLTGDNTDFLCMEGKTGPYSRKVLNETFKQIEGTYLQRPPAFSASKFEGRPLYAWAREGRFIQLEAKKRFVHSVEILKYHHPYLSLKVCVSSGTYVRTLFDDCAKMLGTRGVLVGLVRTAIGPFHSSNALKQSQWKNYQQNKISLSSGIPLKEQVLDHDTLEKFRNRPKEKVFSPANESMWVKNIHGQTLGLASQEGYPLVHFPIGQS